MHSNYIFCYLLPITKHNQTCKWPTKMFAALLGVKKIMMILFTRNFDKKNQSGKTRLRKSWTELSGCCIKLKKRC